MRQEIHQLLERVRRMEIEKLLNEEVDRLLTKEPLSESELVRLWDCKDLLDSIEQLKE